jgi:serine/threonine-protein kinase
MNNLTRAILFLIVALALGLGPSLQAANSYAAVAYSPSTGQWGYGNGYPSQAAAIARARSECGRGDARTFWCKNAWIALAISDSSPGGFGWAWAPTAASARRKALAQCRARNPDARVVVCVSAYR